MNKFIRLIVPILLIGLFACTGGTKDSSVPQRTLPPALAKKHQQVKPVLVDEEKEQTRYKVSGQRDPFQPYEISIPGELRGENNEPLSPLQKLTLSQIELVGIIWGTTPRALIQDSSGMGYIVTEGTMLGENSGIITNISKNGLIIKQHFKDYMGRVNTREVLLSLRKEEGVD